MFSHDQPHPLTDESAPGQLIAGFTIQGKIGEGAMAVLYLLTDKDGNRFSLKMPRQRLGGRSGRPGRYLNLEACISHRDYPFMALLI